VFVHSQLFGAALVGLGIYVQVQLKDYLDFFSSDVNGPAILLIVVGTITFVVAFFGCCGAFKENYCMVMTVSTPLNHHWAHAVLFFYTMLNTATMFYRHVHFCVVFAVCRSSRSNLHYRDGRWHCRLCSERKSQRIC